MLNIELASKLCDLLESGNYKQGRGLLRKMNRDGESEYCCLGVLCDAVKDEIGGRWKRARGHSSMFSLEFPCTAFGEKELGKEEVFQEVTYYLPSEVCKMIGLTARGGYKRNIDDPPHVWYKSKGWNYTQLSDMNDNGIPFETISACIRALIAQEEAFLQGQALQGQAEA